MHKHTTRLLTTLAAAALLLTAITTNATARNFSTTEQSFSVSWRELEFSAGVNIRCRVRLEGSFHSRTIAKVARSLIGAITRAIVSQPCTGGEVWADSSTEVEPLGASPNKLPFHLTYESFAGTLPAIGILDVLLSRISFVIQATILGLTCRGRYGRPEDNITLIAGREAGGGITSIRPRSETNSNRASLVEQLGPNAVCASTLAFNGTSGALTNLSTGATITITLI